MGRDKYRDIPPSAQVLAKSPDDAESLTTVAYFVYKQRPTRTDAERSG